jgi:hypothetical protein
MLGPGEYDYLGGRSTLAAYRWARRCWLGFIQDARSRGAPPGAVQQYQREAAWWRQHTSRARQAP